MKRGTTKRILDGGLGIAGAIFLLSAGCYAETVSLVTTDRRGVAVTNVVALTEVGGGVLRLKVPVADIRPDARWFDIRADFATAKKGDAGYWIFPRGVYGTFREDRGTYVDWAMLPVYGMKTPERTFVAIVSGMRYEYQTHVEVVGGVYTVFQRYLIGEIGGAPYEDIVVDFHRLRGDEANYSGMARAYRAYQLARGAVRPIPDRIASGESPDLAYLCDALPVRITHASKPYRETQNIDYTPANELPVKTVTTFKEAEAVVDAIKAAGIDKLAICTAGWQSGGYDGRCPQTFPVEPAAGGEVQLRAYIRYVHSQGYLIDAHSNFTDAYTVSPLWSTNIVCKKPDGALAMNAYWCGGRAYDLCPRNAWETFFQTDIEKIGTLGFGGAHYIDVFSATRPYACYDPKHPCNRKEAGEYQRKMLHRCKELFGGAASECGWDHAAGELDYVNYTARYLQTFYEKNKKPALVDGVVPFWEIVYHGIILSNPDKITQNKLDPVNALRLIEFGGRPIFYSATKNNVADLKAAYEAFKPVRYLQKAFMQSHEFLAAKVVRVTYSDGSEIVCNYADTPFAYRDRNVGPVSYALFKR
jgi:hypothetical protein